MSNKTRNVPRPVRAVVPPARDDGIHVIYLDHNSTTPIDARVFSAMKPYLVQMFGNAASRTHSLGHEAERAVAYARSQVAALLNANANEIIWTSGATEANNLAIKGVAHGYRDRGRHIITQATEHLSVLDPCRWLEGDGFQVTVLPVDGLGQVDPAQIAGAIRPDTILVSVMWANNEIGTILPLHEIGKVCRERGVLLHSDATQAVGKVSIDLSVDHVDLLSLSGHKLYAPKGVGALYVRNRHPRTKIVPLLHGGGHERGIRSGTINVPSVVALGVACELSRKEMSTEAARLSSLRDALENGIMSRIDGVRVNGDRLHRLPQTTHIAFKDIESEGMLLAMSDVAVSTGSACTSASVNPSHVLVALGMDEESIYGSIRFGLGRTTTSTDVDIVITRVVETVSRLRELRQTA